MQITEVRIKLITAKNDKLRAFCSITIDNDFVVRDLKVIEGSKGPFVAMPSRKVMVRCLGCGEKNHHRANFCNECGARQSVSRDASPGDGDARGRENSKTPGGSKMHADIAHPINSECREVLQRRVLEHYESELERSKQPDYRPAEFDDDFEPSPFDRGGARGSGGSRISAGRPEAVDSGVSGRDDRGSPRDSRLSEARTQEPASRSEERARHHPERARHEKRGSDGWSPEPETAVDEGKSVADSRPEPAPERRRPLLDDSEPEDNFGAGLFS